jgi:hypothetical protein
MDCALTLKDWLSPLATLVGAGAAAWAVTWTIQENWKIQREQAEKNAKIQSEQTARNAYIKYIALAFHNPEFAEPDWKKINLSKKTFDPPDNLERKESDDPEERFKRYCWFVSVMMNTADFVFAGAPEGALIQEVMILQIAYHWKYIECFKEKSPYLKYRYKQYQSQIDKGISLGPKVNPWEPS